MGPVELRQVSPAQLTSEISNGCNKEREGCWQVEHADRSYRYKTESQKHDGEIKFDKPPCFPLKLYE